jgi:aryl-alcohol dehydrogenase-like predicted oxidoreductase
MKSFGRTGLVVSQVSLGTVALGLDYGIELPHEPRRPNEKDAIRLLQQAADEGINLFDTAPAYGDSERLLGLALGRRPGCYIATKVSIPVDADGKMFHGAPLREAVRTSLGNSLRNVGRDVLDIVQIHNATPEVIARGEIAEALREAQSEGKVRFLGASVYGEEAALAAIEAGCFDALQVAYNLLDQRMARRVFPTASRAGVGIIVRSALLKGALTEKAKFLPRELERLRSASEQARDRLAGSWGNLPGVALRFCLSAPDVATVLVGATTRKEVELGLLAANYGPLSAEQLDQTSSLALTDEHLLNPSYWSM